MMSIEKEFNPVYERNAKASKAQIEHQESDNLKFIGGMQIQTLKLFQDLIKEYYNSVPKHIVETDRQNYQYLLKRCDKIARDFNGSIQGFIKDGDCAKISLTLPFMEFCTEAELQLLKEISDMASNVTFEPADGNRIRMTLRIDYFKEDVEFEDFFADKVKEFMQQKGISFEEAAKRADIDIALLKMTLRAPENLT